MSDDDSETAAGADESEPQEDALTPEEQFRRAVENLDDEEIPNTSEAETAAAKRGDPGGDEPRERDSASPADTALAEEFDEIDRESLPDVSERVERSNESREADHPETRAPMEKFEESLEGLSRSEMRRKKYDERDRSGEERVQGDGAGEDGADEGGEDGGREREIGNLGEVDPEVSAEAEATFEAAMRDVEPMETDTSKHRRHSTPDPEEHLIESERRRPEDFVTPTLPKSGEGLNSIEPLGDAQEALLERCEAWARERDVPVLHLRGERVDEAIERLRRFFQQARMESTSFLRIVHGRGRNSEGPPVLKPAVLEWLEQSAAGFVKGYAPERNLEGDYGSVVVELLEP